MSEISKALARSVDRSSESTEAAAAAARSFVERAAKERLVDVAYATVDSPLGPLVVASTRRGLVRISYGELEPTVDDLAAKISPRVLEAPAKLDEIRRELDQYFEGRRARFEVPLDLSLVAGFRRRVLAATAKIPFGELATYRDVATKAGNAKAVRAAGNAVGANPIPIVVPCHRVVRTGGGLGGYTGGLERKRLLLRIEGTLPD